MLLIKIDKRMIYMPDFHFYKQITLSDMIMNISAAEITLIFADILYIYADILYRYAVYMSNTAEVFYISAEIFIHVC